MILLFVFVFMVDKYMNLYRVYESLFAIVVVRLIWIDCGKHPLFWRSEDDVR